MSMRPSGDTARGLVFDDFVDKQVVHVSATSFRSGAERVSMTRGCQPNLHRLISAAIGRWVTSDPAELPFLPGRKKLCTNAVEYNP